MTDEVELSLTRARPPLKITLQQATTLVAGAVAGQPPMRLELRQPSTAPAAMVAAIHSASTKGTPVMVSPTRNFDGPALWVRTDPDTGAVLDLLLVSASELSET